VLTFVRRQSIVLEGGETLARYKLFSVDDSNRIVARHYRALHDDVSALEMATRYSTKTGCEVEVWEGQRFVARVKHDGTASEHRTSRTA
jgi:hypothetical protein